MRWLVPRPVQLEHRYPELQIALTTTTDHTINFKTEPYDAAIVFGTQLSAGDLLFEEALTPVMSADYSHHDALEKATLLHPTRDKTDWSLWLAKQQLFQPAMRKNQHFDTMDLAITAAIQGLGVAIADETLVEEDVRAGRLLRPFARSVKTGASYRLVLRESHNKAAGLAAFRQGLLGDQSSLTWWRITRRKKLKRARIKRLTEGEILHVYSIQCVTNGRVRAHRPASEPAPVIPPSYGWRRAQTAPSSQRSVRQTHYRDRSHRCTMALTSANYRKHTALHCRATRHWHRYRVRLQQHNQTSNASMAV